MISTSILSVGGFSTGNSTKCGLTAERGLFRPVPVCKILIWSEANRAERALFHNSRSRSCTVQRSEINEPRDDSGDAAHVHKFFRLPLLSGFGGVAPLIGTAKNSDNWTHRTLASRSRISTVGFCSPRSNRPSKNGPLQRRRRDALGIVRALHGYAANSKRLGRAPSYPKARISEVIKPLDISSILWCALRAS